MTQPEALRLADALECGFPVTGSAAAELRRLHASCEDYAQHKQRQDQRILKLYAQRDALLEALKTLVLATKDVSVGHYNEEVHDIALSTARAVIKTVENV
jgi:hypothetical protein